MHTGQRIYCIGFIARHCLFPICHILCFIHNINHYIYGFMHVYFFRPTIATVLWLMPYYFHCLRVCVFYINCNLLWFALYLNCVHIRLLCANQHFLLCFLLTYHRSLRQTAVANYLLLLCSNRHSLGRHLQRRPRLLQQQPLSGPWVTWSGCRPSAGILPADSHLLPSHLCCCISTYVDVPYCLSRGVPGLDVGGRGEYMQCR